MRRSLIILFLLLLSGRWLPPVESHAQSATREIAIQPGDSWTALGLRFQAVPADLQAAYGHINRQWQPPIGTNLSLPDGVERLGSLSRPRSTLLSHALQTHQSPWQIALQNGRSTPFHPALYAPILTPADSIIRDLPPGFDTLDLTPNPPQPGQAFGLKAATHLTTPPVIQLGSEPLDLFLDAGDLLALGSTGAFFAPFQPELNVVSAEGVGWSQPWAFAPGDWEFQEVTFTGSADVDQEAIQQERARLFEIWTQTTPVAQWETGWIEPLGSYLYVSAPYGARRSVNGGPYTSYHEGVDFAAYGGTPVVAPAAGTVVLAEMLGVRGGSVIVDHGLGVYTGFYHLSEVDVAMGSAVAQGDLLGKVGSTGRSTGNHLHWDLLVNGRWVDASAWLAQDLACWIGECLPEVSE